MGRPGRVEDIALAAIYLASEASSYVTGVTIETTGGPPFSAFLLEEAERECSDRESGHIPANNYPGGDFLKWNEKSGSRIYLHLAR